jgi:hypothetical protein
MNKSGTDMSNIQRSSSAKLQKATVLNAMGDEDDDSNDCITFIPE